MITFAEGVGSVISTLKVTNPPASEVFEPLGVPTFMSMIPGKGGRIAAHPAGATRLFGDPRFEALAGTAAINIRANPIIKNNRMKNKDLVFIIVQSPTVTG